MVDHIDQSAVLLAVVAPVWRIRPRAAVGAALLCEPSAPSMVGAARVRAKVGGARDVHADALLEAAADSVTSGILGICA